MKLTEKCPNQRSCDRGFTLTELLLAIVILAIVAGIGATNYLTSLKRGNDGKRAADLNNLRSALEMYFLDGKCAGGVKCYPNTGGSWLDINSVLGTGVLVSDYTRQLPADPKSDQHYLYKSADGVCYCLSAKMEIEENKTPGGSLAACSCPSAPEDHRGTCYLVTCP